MPKPATLDDVRNSIEDLHSTLGLIEEHLRSIDDKLHNRKKVW